MIKEYLYTNGSGIKRPLSYCPYHFIFHSYLYRGENRDALAPDTAESEL